MTQPDLRASDDDRRRVVSELERHTAAGRLSLDEFSERVSRVYTATTHGDLAQIIHDLPTAPPAPPTPGSNGDHRYLLIALVLALVTIVALGVVFAIFKP
jgi:hypothetical protein